MTEATRSEQDAAAELEHARANMDADLQRQLEAVLGSYHARLQQARDADDRNKQLSLDNAGLMARVEEQQRALRAMELDMLESRRREAKALEEIGILKGIMQTHGASIADVVGRIGDPARDLGQPHQHRARPQPDLAALERVIGGDNSGGQA